jgi:hypothetical protein
MNLKYIFDAITPENIKNIPVIRSAMDIFIQNLEKNAKVAKDIRKIYESDNENVKIALIKTYLNSLYNVISKAQTSKVIKNKLDEYRLSDVPLKTKITSILTEENAIIGKSQKEKTGTKVGIEYAYNLAMYLETGFQVNDFNIEEIQPFHFKTDGSLFKEIYESIVKPISHPIGFTYDYNQVIKDSITDFFGVNIIYDFSKIEVRCFSIMDFYVFTDNEDDSLIKVDFLSRINPLTNAKFTESEFYTQVNINYNKVVKEYLNFTIDRRIYKCIIFNDDTVLEQYTNPIDIKYRTLYNYNNNIEEYIETYDTHSSLFLDYVTDYEFIYNENIEVYETLEVTKIKENNNGNSGQQNYNLTSEEYAFHVGGEEYKFIQGIDETQLNYVEPYGLITEINSTYTTTLSGYAKYGDTISLKISDKYNNEINVSDLVVNTSNIFSTNINLSPLRGDIYTISVNYTHNGITYNKYLTTLGLNDFDRTFTIDTVENWNHIITDNVKISGKALANSNIVMTIIDNNNNTVVLNTDVTSNGTYSIIGNSSIIENGNFRIEGVCTNGANVLNTFFISTDLNTHIEDLYIKVNTFNYVNGAPNYIGLLNVDNLSNIEEMYGFDTYDSSVKKQIGELAINDTYANPDVFVLEYMEANDIDNIDDMNETVNISGSIIEGCDYDTSTFNQLDEEETFISLGRKLYPIDTSDFIIVTSSTYCSDEFTGLIISSTGYYFYLDELNGIDRYLYTTDEQYLTVYTDTE